MSLALFGRFEVRCRTLPSARIVNVFTTRLAMTSPPRSAASRMVFVAGGLPGLPTLLTLVANMALTIERGQFHVEFGHSENVGMLIFKIEVESGPLP